MSDYEDKMIHSREIYQKVYTLSRGIRFDTSSKTTLYSAYFDLALEHYCSVVTLMENEKYGSSFALVRPIFEAFYKAMWVSRVATDKEIKKIHRNRDIFPRFKEMASQTDVKLNAEVPEGAERGRNVLRNVANKHWVILNDFTHGGMNQLSRRFNPETNNIDSFFEDDDKIRVLDSASGTILLFAYFVFKDINEIDKAVEVGEMLINSSRDPGI